MKRITKTSDYLFYRSEDGLVKVQVVLADKTVWLTLTDLVRLFGVEKSTIEAHLSEIYDSKELSKEESTKRIRVVSKDRPRRVVRAREYYNLDAIVSVGYRINPKKATRFRKWANEVIKEYLVSGNLPTEKTEELSRFNAALKRALEYNPREKS